MPVKDDLHFYRRGIQNNRTFSAEEVQQLMNYFENKLMVLIDLLGKSPLEYKDFCKGIK